MFICENPNCSVIISVDMPCQEGINVKHDQKDGALIP